MFPSLLLALALHGAVADKAAPPDKLELFAREDWYRDARGKEQDFVGKLEKVKVGGIGFGRMNPYRLVMKKETREVYVGSKPQLLAPYVGKTIKLIGKPVDMEVEGKEHHEIWPARLEVVSEKKSQGSHSQNRHLIVALADEPAVPRIVARSFWRAPGGTQAPAQQVVVREEDQLARLMGLPKEKALEQAAKLFKTDKIDFQKQMIVVVTAGAKPTGGYAVTITKLSVKDNTLTVHWSLKSPGPGDIVTQAFTHPAQAALVDHFKGKVVFDPPAPRGGPRDR